jgi:hypothetical protein
MLTQIYEISTPDEARSISEIGVDHIGVLAGNEEFPREVSLQAVSRVAAAILPPSKLSLLILHFSLRYRAAYSITSSARARIEAGMSRPSAFAVLRLIINSIVLAR